MTCTLSANNKKVRKCYSALAIVTCTDDERHRKLTTRPRLTGTDGSHVGNQYC